MKKQVSTLSLIALAAFSIWQYFTEHKKDTKPAPTTTQQQSQSAVKNTKDFGNYDVIMRDDAIGQNKNAPVDYYMLALSWSPAFCEKQRAQYGNNLPDSAQYQCSIKNQFGWVVHGLWPQNANARSVTDHPRFCKGDLAPLPIETLEPYLSISPGAKLLQGEWEKHGSCAFDSAEDY
ncbi:MAG: ribonuclease, partial [Haemophilus parainfluenzae]